MHIPGRTKTLITFEHPANEQTRLYLRLEGLYNELQNNAHQENPNNSKQALIALLKMINVVDRPDLKSKLVQVLTVHATSLSHLSQSPEVDNQALQNILNELHQHIAFLHNHKGKIAEQLRKNEFLTQMRLHLTNPAGLCQNVLPPLNLWLNQSHEQRQHDLLVWSKPFTSLLNALGLLLKLIRESTNTVQTIAKKGYFQQNQDPALPCELIRISVDGQLNVFPEFSANKHRVIIRFLEPDLYNGGKPTQSQSDVEFFLRCCRI